MATLAELATVGGLDGDGARSYSTLDQTGQDRLAAIILAYLAQPSSPSHETAIHNACWPALFGRAFSRWADEPDRGNDRPYGDDWLDAFRTARVLHALIGAGTLRVRGNTGTGFAYTLA